MKKIIIIIFITTFITSCKNQIVEEDEEVMKDIKINIKINETDFKANLENNKTVKELLELLPLEIEMNELNNNEKYYYLEESLSTNSYNPQKINKGDIMLYGNNCLVIFYKDFKNSYSYTKLGKIENVENLESELGSDNVKVLISIITEEL